MRIYHGCPSPAKLQKAREVAPSYEHGEQWNPDKMTPHDEPYILDNGCWSASVNSEIWTPEKFFVRLGEVAGKMPRKPDFVVVPDVPGEPDVTLERSLLYVREVRDFGYPYYLPLQDGVNIRNGVALAHDIGADGVFIGGSDQWKKHYTRKILTYARKRRLNVHIGSPPSLLWAEGIGVDSVDTTTIVRNERWDKLRQLERQDGLTISPKHP